MAGKILVADCKDILPSIRDFDVAVVDPPFNLGEGRGLNDGLSPNQYLKWYGDRISLVVRALKPDAMLYIHMGDKYSSRLLETTEASGTRFDQFVIWVARNIARPSMGNFRASQHELVGVFRKGAGLPYTGTNRVTVCITPRPQSNFKSERRWHPAQKPVELYKFLLSAHKPGKLLDPFCGSGSSLVAAKELGWDYLGIEIEEDFAVKAEERVLLASPRK